MTRSPSKHSDHHSINSGPSATATSNPLTPQQRTAALRNLCITAVTQHPGDGQTPTAAAETALREVAEMLNLINTPAPKLVGHCRKCGRERSVYSASQHTGGPADLCATCGRATRKAATAATRQPITERA